MPQLLIRNLSETTVRRLKKRALRQGRSLEGEVREMLTRGAATLTLDEAREVTEAWHKRFAGRKFRDSADVVREEREARDKQLADASRR